jgi:hypothetical protein
MKTRLFAAALVGALLLAQPETARAQDGEGFVAAVVRGPSPIEDSDCQSAGDLTLDSGRLLVSIAAETPPRWGIPPGALLDASLKGLRGDAGHDLLLFFDVIPDGWGKWDAAVHSVEVLQEGGSRASALVTRRAGDLVYEIRYSVEAGATVLEVEATISNRGATTRRIKPGLNLSVRHGRVFQPQPLGASKLEPWFTSYGDDFSVSLLMPGATAQDGGGTWRDLYRTVEIKPGAKATVLGLLFFSDVPESNQAAARAAFLATHRAPARVSGTIQFPPEETHGPTVAMVRRRGKAFAWGLLDSEGRWSLTLPPGDYSLEALSAGGAGPLAKLALKAGETRSVDLAPPPEAAHLVLDLTDSQGRPLDALVHFEDLPCTLDFLCRAIAYTGLRPRGHLEVSVPAGKRRLLVSHGAPFLMKPVPFTLPLNPGLNEVALSVEAPLDFRPQGIHWLDLHQHSLAFDGLTPPRDLVAANLAAGLAAVFLSDHDCTRWHTAVEGAAGDAGLPLVASVEVSPPWGHFNVFPLPSGTPFPADLRHDRATEEAIGRFAGQFDAMVQLNHPWEGDSGYMSIKETQGTEPVIPPFVRFLEFNGKKLFDPSDEKVLAGFIAALKAGRHILLSAGTDTHDVFKDDGVGTGRVRNGVFAPPDADLGQILEALEAGHSFVTFGPVMQLSPPPGRFQSTDGPLVVKLKAESLSGLASLRIYDLSQDRPNHRDLAGAAAMETELTFGPGPGIWFIEMTDKEGNRAFSNPWRVAE